LQTTTRSSRNTTVEMHTCLTDYSTTSSTSGNQGHIVTRTAECQKQYVGPCVLVPSRHHTYSVGHVDGDKTIRTSSSEKTYYTQITTRQTHTTVKLSNHICNSRDPCLVVTGCKNLSKVQTGKLLRIISVVVFGTFPTNL